MKPFILILTFLTRIPIPMNFEFQDEDFVKGTRLFPIIGAIIGLLIAPLYWVSEFIPGYMFPFLVIIWYLLIVGGIHIDGVADLFDGIFSARKRERILVIMDDSRVGTFGVIGLVLYFLGMYLGLLGVSADVDGWMILISFPVIGRIMGQYVSGICHYAKEKGLGQAIIDNTKPVHSVLYVILSLSLTFILGLPFFIATLITIVLITIIVLRISHVLDGITGDVVGAMVEISQVIYLVVIAIGTYNGI